MAGTGVSGGAVSVMNAIPCGIGAAIGIKLRTEAVFRPADSVSVELAGRPGMGLGSPVLVPWLPGLRPQSSLAAARAGRGSPVRDRQQRGGRRNISGGGHWASTWTWDKNKEQVRRAR